MLHMGLSEVLGWQVFTACYKWLPPVPRPGCLFHGGCSMSSREADEIVIFSCVHTIDSVSHFCCSEAFKVSIIHLLVCLD